MPQTWEPVAVFSPDFDWETVSGNLGDSSVILITPEFARDPEKALAKIVFRVTIEDGGVNLAYRTFGFWPQEYKGRIFDIALPSAFNDGSPPSRSLELKLIKPYRFRYKPPEIALDDTQQMLLNIERLL